MITVKRLIKLLQAEDPDRTVLLSSDPEGNSYATLSSLTTCAFREEDCQIELGLEKLTSGAKKQGYTQEDVMTDGKPALVLYP